jgi:hypothetical protein
MQDLLSMDADANQARKAKAIADEVQYNWIRGFKTELHGESVPYDRSCSSNSIMADCNADVMYPLLPGQISACCANCLSNHPPPNSQEQFGLMFKNSIGNVFRLEP